MIGVWLFAWALAFGFGIDLCTVESRKYLELGGFGWVLVWVCSDSFGWVWLKIEIRQS